jgi:carboxypeptidase Taq
LCEAYIIATMSNTLDENLKKLHALDREVVSLENVGNLLAWDAEVNMPEAAVEERAEQRALISGITHAKAVNPEIDRLLKECGSATENPSGDLSLPAVERDFLKVMRRNYDRDTKLPPEFVEEMSRTEGVTEAAWEKAKRANDFASFAPHLEKMLEVMKQAAVYWSGAKTGADAYDCLLDVYEPGLTAAGVEQVFTPLGERLSALLKKIAAKPAPDYSFLSGEDCPVYPAETQDKYCRSLLPRLGWETDRRGRLLKGHFAQVEHPFTESFGRYDARITTHYYEQDPLSGVLSAIHESGHAFYMLDAGKALGSTSLGNDGASMAVHESQSRLWENVIGRSRAFWSFELPHFKEFFPEQLKGVSLDAFYRAMNRVQPSFVRTEADEVTYSLHIILRFEIERRLFDGTLAVKDLPAAWNAEMKKYLGIVPPTDTLGVLQDVHWSEGSFGYFPSYALGNLYGLQAWEALKNDIPDVDDDIAKGNFAPIHAWLGENIHRWGRRLDPPDLIKKATGKPLSADAFLTYIETKYGELYGL